MTSVSRSIFQGLFSIAIFVALLFAHSVELSAKNVYVSTSGSDSSAGAQSTPYRTIAKGVANISAGDTLFVCAGACDGAGSGTYSEGLNGMPNGTNWTTGAVTVKAYPGETVTLIGDSGGITFLANSYIIVDGINVDHTGTQQSVGGVGITNSHHIRLQNGVYTDGGLGNGIIFMSLYAGCFSYIEILNNEIHHANATHAAAPSASHGIYLTGSSTSAEAALCQGVDLHVLIKGNNIHDNNDQSYAYGVQVYGSSFSNSLNGVTIEGNRIHNNGSGLIIGWGQMPGLHRVFNNLVYNNLSRGIDINRSIGALVYNNTIANHNTALDVGAGSYARGAIIKNNVVTGCSVPLQIWDTDGSSFVTAQSNDFFCGSPSDLNRLSTITGNLSIDPRYADPTGTTPDLRQGASALVDGGVDLSATLTYAFDGTPRPSGAAFDIGAYEVGTPVPTLPAPPPPPPAEVYNRAQIAADAFTAGSTVCLNSYSSSWTLINDGGTTNCVKVDSVNDVVYGTTDSYEGWAARHNGTFTNDQYASLKITALPADNSDGLQTVGVAARMGTVVGGSRSQYDTVVYMAGTTQYTSLVKVANGVRTTLAETTSVTWSVGDRIEIEAFGATISVLKDGVVVQSYEDSNPIASGKPGIVMAGGAGNRAAGDDFIGGNLYTGTLTNQAPTVNAGAAQTITLPATATLAAIASDDGLPNGALTYQWSVVSGSGVTFTSPTSAATQASFSSAGARTLKVTVSDGLLSSSGNVVISVNAAPVNLAPVSNAGPDQTITLPGTAALTAAATTDDGLPTGSTLTYQWSVVSGTGVTFTSPTSAAAQAAFSSAGARTLKVTVSDGLLSSSDNVVISVNAAPVNLAPISNAGPDQTITLPATAALTAAATTDDGLPSGSTLTYLWSVVSGSGVTFTSPTSATTQASFSSAGARTLNVTVSDGLLSSSDNVTVSVSAAPVTNLAPISNAGPDQTITLPATAALTAAATTDDGLPAGSALTYLWSEVNGSGTTFTSANSPATQVSFSSAGPHTLRITVSDGLLSSSDDIVVSANDPIYVRSRVASDAFTTTTTACLDTYSAIWTLIHDGGTVNCVKVDGANGVIYGTTDSYVGWVARHNGTFANDQYASLKITALPDDNSDGLQTVGVGARIGAAIGANRTEYNTVVYKAGTTQYTSLIKVANGARTTLGETTSVTWSAGDHIEIEAFSSTVRVLKDGIVVLSYVDPSPIGGGKPGVVMAGGAANRAAGDDFIGGNLLAGPLTNQAPAVNAGAAQTITLPAAASITAIASDDALPNSVLTYQWSVVTGSGVTFTSPTSAATQVSFSSPGDRTLRITVNDGLLSAISNVTISVNAAPPTNLAPVSNAGPDQTITLPATAALTAAASTDDGLPTGSALTYLWSVVSGSGVTFTSPTSAATQASFSSAGARTLKVTVSDGLLSSSDNVVISVNAAPPTNLAPVSNAGPDQTITLPGTAALTAAATTDDGLPSGSTLTYQWSVVSGSGVTFTSPTSATTQASFSSAGARTLKVTVGDGLLSSSDNVTVSVNAAPVTNLAPISNAGPDQTITLPATAALTAAATTDDGLPAGSALTYLWSEVNGSGAAFTSANSPSTQVSFSSAGPHTLRITVSDGLLSSSDDVVVSANDSIYVRSRVSSDAFTTTTTACLDTYSAIWTLIHDSGTVNCVKVDGANGVIYGTTDSYVGWVARHNGTFANDQYASLKIAALPDDNSDGLQTVGVGARIGAAIGANRSEYNTVIYKAGTTQYTSLIKVANGARTTLAETTSVTWSAGDHIEIEAVGATIRVLKDGVVVYSYVDPSPIAGGTPGVVMAGGAGNRAAGDDFIGGNLLTGPLTNQAPAVNAGAAQTITLPAAASITAIASDDALPNSVLTYQWSVVTGTGVTFASPNSAATQVSFSSSGARTLRVTVNDGQLSATSNVTITVNAAPPTNLAPVSNAGPDQTITLPGTAALTAATSTDDGLPTGTLTYQWAVVSGSGVTFTSPTSAATQASFSSAGARTLRVTVSDGLLSSSDNVVISVNAAPPTNLAPVSNAGPDQTITLPGTAALTAAATTDDGLPTGSTLTYQWSVVSGSGVTFTNPTSAATQASFSSAGAFTLKVTVSDGLLSSSDNVVISVNAAPANLAPVSNAGPDQTITLPGTATLTAAASTDDNLPSGSTLTYQWTVVSGSGVTFASPNSAVTQVSFASAGARTLKVTVSDGLLSSSDNVVVSVVNSSLTLIVSKTGETLKGITPISARSDDTRTQRLELLIDGNIKATAVGNSLSYRWDTKLISGNHTVQAIAYGAGGILASKSIVIFVK